MSEKKTSRWGIALSALMIFAGFLAIVLPPAAGLAVTVIAGCLFILSGAAHFAYAWHRRKFGKVAWEAGLGVLYAAAGVYLLWNPLAGLVSLTVALTIWLAIEAAIELSLSLEFRPLPAWRWILLDAIVTYVLAILIAKQWPSSSAWAIGLLVGLSMVFSGFARLMISIDPELHLSNYESKELVARGGR